MTLHLLLPVVLLPATLSGELTRRVGLTALVGEVFVGVALGPEVLNMIPERGMAPAFYELGHIGLCALLFRLGMHSRPNALLSAWRSGLLVGIVGLVLSFVLGAGLSMVLGWDTSSAVFVGAALTATSISVPLSVLREARKEQSAEGTTILAAAFVTDLLGLVGLSILTVSLSGVPRSTLHVAATVGQSVAFIAGGFLVGPFLMRRLLRMVGRLGSRTVLMTIGFSYFLLVAYAAKALGLAMVIGAYAAGLAFTGLRERDRLEQEVDPLILFLRPLFFVLAGASISFSGLDPSHSDGRRLIALTAAVLAIGVAAKLAGPLLLTVDRAKKLVIGFGLDARGEMGFVFAEVGMASGLLPTQLFSAVALALTGTTIVGALGLRMALAHASGSPAESRESRPPG